MAVAAGTAVAVYLWLRNRPAPAREARVTRKGRVRGVSWNTTCPRAMEAILQPRTGFSATKDVERRFQTELGIKRRDSGAKIELKSLVAVSEAHLTVPPFVGPVEIWTKASSTLLKFDQEAAVRIQKRRWLRQFDASTAVPMEMDLREDESSMDGRERPAEGCQVEFTVATLAASGESWWTFAFESFGTLRRIETTLHAVVAVLARRDPPGLTNGILASYPAWLAIRDPGTPQSART